MTKATETTFYATRNFKDAGTEREFEKGKPLEGVDEDTARNYVAAGAASTEKPVAEKSGTDKPSAEKATA